MTKRELLAVARRHGTPVVVVDHDVIRSNYAGFLRRLPKVQAYYAVKANPAPDWPSRHSKPAPWASAAGSRRSYSGSRRDPPQPPAFRDAWRRLTALSWS